MFNSPILKGLGNISRPVPLALISVKQVTFVITGNLVGHRECFWSSHTEDIVAGEARSLRESKTSWRWVDGGAE